VRLLRGPTPGTAPETGAPACSYLSEFSRIAKGGELNFDNSCYAGEQLFAAADSEFAEHRPGAGRCMATHAECCVSAHAGHGLSILLTAEVDGKQVRPSSDARRDRLPLEARLQLVQVANQAGDGRNAQRKHVALFTSLLVHRR